MGLKAYVTITIDCDEIRGAIVESIRRDHGLSIAPERVEFTFGGNYEDQELTGVEIKLTIEEVTAIQNG